MTLRQLYESIRSLAISSRDSAARTSDGVFAPQAALAKQVDFQDVQVWEPQALAKLGSLELISQTVVDGFVSGKHRSTHKGGCSEFAGYRAYSPGDDLRKLDWKLYAKSDRYYVKHFDDETNLQALIVVDASGSMRFGRTTVSKWDYARMAAACLARLLIRQRDSAGLAVVSEAGTDYLPPVSRTSHLTRVISALTTAKAMGETQLPAALSALSNRLTRRGMVVLISDCFGDVAALRTALQQFRIRGHDVLVLQTLAPEEITFPFSRSSEFVDLESVSQLHIQPAHIRRSYIEHFTAFQKKLATSVTQSGCDYSVLTTDQELGNALANFLRRRSAATVVNRPPANANALTAH